MPYKTDGYEVKVLLSESQLDGMCAVIEDQLDAAISDLKVPFELTFPGLGFGRRLERIARLDNKAADALLLKIYQGAHLDERIHFLDGHGKLREIAESLVGRPITSFTIRARANVPSLPARRQGWHSDVSLLDGGEFSKVKVACWIPLMDVDIHNGTLEVVPGMRDYPMVHNGDLQNHTIREEDLEGLEKRAIRCPRGSALFLDAFVPHRAIPNLSDQARWSVVVWMMK
jgi:hypothetical protein